VRAGNTVNAAAVLTLSLCCALAGRAWGQTCTAAATAVAFGTYQPLTGPSLSSTGTVTITCQATVSILVSYTIELSIGSGSSFATRSMSGVSPPLHYQLYRDAADTQIWGDGTAGTYVVTDGYLLGIVLPVVKTYTVYGIVPAGESAAVGAYSDMVVVTLIY
jgi:spore coat protein U-like protein